MSSGFFRNKKVLVTGGTGMIGRSLVEMLIKEGTQVRIASLDAPSRAHPQAEFRRVDLTRFDQCLSVCRDMDFVFHLAGVKGSPAMTSKRPATFFVPTLLFNTNVLEAARQSGVRHVLYTSSIGVYAPSEIFREDEVWKTFPSPHDKFAGWAKRMGELQAESYAIEYGWDHVSIVRPANVYGPYDNFDPQNAMVIPSLIRRVMDGENPLRVWGDGTPIRDFIHTRDVARGMMWVVERQFTQPVNLGSGTGFSIKQVVEMILKVMGQNIEVVWDTSKPSGDQIRLMDISRMQQLGWSPSVSLEDGIRETIEWFKQNRSIVDDRYNVFKESKPVS